MSRQHTDKLLDSPSAGLGFLGGVNPKQNRVAILAVQAREEGFGFGVLVERGLQIVRYRGYFLAFVRSGPTPVSFCSFHRRQSGSFHAAELDKLCSGFTIDLRPDTSRPARNELLQPRGFALRSFRAIDPAVTEGSLESFFIGDRVETGILLGQTHPDPAHRGMVLRQPFLP